jgi:HTH-type transcriptional repressor of NAD biosynthesis genes
MEKKFKSGLVLGKFAPFHLGHKYLIDTAIENCEHVHVIVSHNKTQNIPGDVRYLGLKKTYQNNPNVTVYQFDDTGLPQHDYECESLKEFYSYWVPEIYNLVDDLDVVFTSEDYGESFAEYLGVEHFLVDKERKNVPISGTDVRENPFKKWDFISDELKPFFVKRIAIMGPESVGKSTLTKELANWFQTNFVDEYGRIVYEGNGNKVGVEDFIPISEGRQSLEDWAIKRSNKLLFCDTEDITTYLFLDMYCPNEDHEKETEWFLNKLSEKKKYDLYILLKTDCDAVQDGTRSFLEERQAHYEVIKNELVNRGCHFVEVGGTWRERFDTSVEIIKNNFNI